LQCFYIGIYGFIYSWFTEGPINLTPLLDFSNLTKASSLSGFLIIAFLSSFFAFSLQAHAQKRVPPHVVSVIFLLEAPFAAIFGFLLLKEDLNLLEIAGCVVVTLAAYVVYTLPDKKESFDSH
jgi:drug/metabolite transporter (DMT)-like permease